MMVLADIDDANGVGILPGLLTSVSQSVNDPATAGKSTGDSYPGPVRDLAQPGEGSRIYWKAAESKQPQLFGAQL